MNAGGTIQIADHRKRHACVIGDILPQTEVPRRADSEQADLGGEGRTNPWGQARPTPNLATPHPAALAYADPQGALSKVIQRQMAIQSFAGCISR
jgi:hypothetical protein